MNAAMGTGNCLSRFAGTRVLVTGDTGFKGSWLAWWLRALGAEVVGYALPPERHEDLFLLLDLARSIHHVNGDIRDLPALQQVCDAFQPQMVFHLAGQAIVRAAYEQPKLTFDTNVGGSVNLLEAVRRTPSVRVLIYVTTDKCYRIREGVQGYREEDELGGDDPYSLSKAAAELVFSAYWDAYFARRDQFGAASVRAGNVLGGGDRSRDRIMPDLVRALVHGTPITLRNPGATRPWQHVLDALHGYLLLAVKLSEAPRDFSGSWNLGPSSDGARTVREVAERTITCWGGEAGMIHIQPGGPPETAYLQLNCDKARRRLGWSPAWDFDRVVDETVRWYREVHAGAPPSTVTTQQILDYMGAPQTA